MIELHDKVIKQGGDYTFEGTVVGIIKKLSGQVRYVVEDDRGLLFIFHGGQLTIIKYMDKED